MKILALEFASPQLSVAVIEADQGRVPCRLAEARETSTRPMRALGLVEAALRAAGLEREQIDCLAIGLGPGSYSGVRCAIALAQGWQLALERAVLGLSSVEVIAAQAQAEGIYGRVGIVVDAQRNEFYIATYEISMASWHEIEPLRLAESQEVQARAQAGTLIIGPEASAWFPAARLVFPRAAMLGQLAAERTDFVPAEQLQPIYLRETSFVKAPPARRWD